MSALYWVVFILVRKVYDSLRSHLTWYVQKGTALHRRFTGIRHDTVWARDDYQGYGIRVMYIHDMNKVRVTDGSAICYGSGDFRRSVYGGREYANGSLIW